MKGTCHAIVLMLLTLALVGDSAAAAPVDNLSIQGLTQVSETRVTRTVFRYEYKVSLRNSNPAECTGIQATVASSSSATVVKQASVSFPVLAPEATVLSSGTFTIEQDRRQPFSASNLVWTFSVPAGECEQQDEIGRDIDFTPPPLPNLNDPAIPRAPDGSVPIIEVPGLSIGVDPNAPRDGLTVRGECLRWIGRCESPPDRTLDDCARSAPRCTNAEEPWVEGATCCPEACFEAYRAARVGGATDVAAFEQTFIGGACFPGVPAEN